MQIKNLKLPLSEETTRSLMIGDMITVTGKIFTGRSRFHIRAIEENTYPPIDFEKTNCFFHVGPVTRKTANGWEVVSIEPTSSIRFERYGADVIRKFNIRTLIGKTTMGPRTAEALQEIGGVYLTKIGVCGNQLRTQVKRVEEVHFVDELGKTEATWVMEVEDFGPFFVAIDAAGNNYFENLDQQATSRIPEIEKLLGIPQDYDFTNVNGA